MPSRAPRRCNRCRQLKDADGRCSPQCRTRARARSQRARGSSTAQGYGTQHRTRFRTGVLTRDPVCVRCHAAPATHADHHPLSRKQLVAQGLDPDDPEHGRGLCAPCHSTETARAQPGGWNRR